MSLIARLRDASAPVLFGAAIFDVFVRRAGLGAAGLRIESDAPILETWDRAAASVGAFPVRCLMFAGLLAALATACSDLMRQGRASKLAGAATAVAALSAAWTSVVGGPPDVVAIAMTVFIVRLFAATEPTDRDAAPARVGVALVLAGDVLHRAWAFGVRRNAGVPSWLEPAAEICVPLGLVVAGVVYGFGPRRRRGASLAAAAIAGAVLTSAAAPDGAFHVVRQLFAVGEAGLPRTVVFALSIAAIGAAAAAFATPRRAAMLFVLFATARRPDAAQSLACLGAAALLLDSAARPRRSAPTAA